MRRGWISIDAVAVADCAFGCCWTWRMLLLLIFGRLIFWAICRLRNAWLPSRTMWHNRPVCIHVRRDDFAKTVRRRSPQWILKWSWRCWPFGSSWRYCTDPERARPWRGIASCPDAPGWSGRGRAVSVGGGGGGKVSNNKRKL